MPGTFFGLETARRGIKIHQNALKITGHNLANASTPGFSRQEVVKTASDPFATPHINSSVTPGQFGTGAGVEMIRRIRDEYLDGNVRQTFTDNHYWQDQVMVLNRAQAMFAEPSMEGISDRIIDMFKSWMHLNNTPQDPGAKAAVVELSKELSTLMTYAYNQLGAIEESVAEISGTTVVRGQLLDQVTRINDIMQQLQNLTTSIQRIYATGQQPNDLMDKRDMLLEELSKFGPVKVVFATPGGQPNGEFAELSFFGQNLTSAVNDATQPMDFSLSVSGATPPAPPDLRIELHYNGSSIQDLTASRNDVATGGSLLGLEKSRHDIIGFKERLNNLAVQLRDKIGNVSDPPGHNFFEGDLTSGDFRVNDALIANPALIDGTKANAVADLRNKSDIDFDGDGTLDNMIFEEYYALLVTEAGAAAKSAGGMAMNQAAIHAQITGLRDSVSGVAVDEELTRMLQFQFGFQASARMVTMMDGMLDVIVNRMGGQW